MQALRNKFAHSISKVETLDEYGQLDNFVITKFGKYNSNALEETTYSLNEHKNNMDKINKIMNELSEIGDLRI